MRVLIAIALLALSLTGASAAPFCVVTSYGGTNCWYYDAGECRRAAASAGGACVVNR